MTVALHAGYVIEIFLQHLNAKIVVVTILNCSNLPVDEHAPRVSCLLMIMLFACGLYVAAPAAADVFQFIAEDGTPHFSDQPSDARFRLLLRTGGEVRAEPKGRPARPGLRAARRRFDGEISAAAQANRIDAALLHAVVEVESGYNARAVSPKGALGLMQLMPATARRYGVADPLDAAQNLHGGAHHLRDLLDLFSDNKELALAAYNAGTGAVLAHGRRIPPFAETTRYVPAVLQSYELLRRGTQAIEN